VARPSTRTREGRVRERHGIGPVFDFVMGCEIIHLQDFPLTEVTNVGVRKEEGRVHARSLQEDIRQCA
jgi:hypothetical protein